MCVLFEAQEAPPTNAKGYTKVMQLENVGRLPADIKSINDLSPTHVLAAITWNVKKI